MFWNKKKKVVSLSGMNCDNCIRRVKGALESIPEVDKAKVSINQAVLYYKNNIIDDDIRRKIEELGYTITGIKKVK